MSMKASDLRRKLERDFPKAVNEGKEVRNIVVPRLSSGNFVFDLITQGGIPMHRLTVFHGPKQTSKTTFALMVLGKFLRENPKYKALVVDFEHGFDWDLAKCYITNIDQLIVVQPDYGEQGIDIAKRYLEGADDIGFYLMDSLGQIDSIKEVEADAADYIQLGMQVKLVNRLLRIMRYNISVAKKDNRHCHAILINQVRANMNRRGHMGSPYSQPCGKLLEHAASMDVRFYTGKYKEMRKIPVAVEHEMLIEKNKMGIPKRRGFLKYWLADVNGNKAGDFNEKEVVLSHAKRVGVVDRVGVKWKVGNKEFGTINEVLQAFKENKKMYEKVKERTLKICVEDVLASTEESE